MRSNPSRRGPLLAAALLSVLAVGACSGSAATSAPASTPAPSVAAASGILAELASRKVIDVRTPAEFAAGHIKGAVNIDVEGSEFDAQINALPKGEAYLVYCRSGNRSKTAAGIMKAAGFTNVYDGGGFSALVSAGAKTE